MSANNVASRLSSTGAYALELEGVGRHFGALVALADINLRVGAGERRAVLGSNGAGKTTCSTPSPETFPRHRVGFASSVKTSRSFPYTNESDADCGGPIRSASCSAD